MHYTTYDDAIAKKASSNDVLGYVVERLVEFNDAHDVDLDFVSRADVQVVPQDEATLVLSALTYLIGRKLLTPSADGKASPTLLNDFLPAGTQFQKAKCLGHLWEFQYALAVELEHGTTRGTNVTNNHPLLTGMVVMAHLAEDSLSYARLWVMETQGELFHAQLDGVPYTQMRQTLRHLSLAEKHLQARISEKLDLAS